LKFLLDENVPLSIKKIINDLGHKAITLRDDNKLGMMNGEVAKLSIIKNVTIITLDSDFLSIRKDLQKKSKIIYIKLHPRDPKIIAKIIHKYLEEAVARLKYPGKVILSKNDIKFETP
jgi:predicted nuclease of predicted toxin-antitoxin system